MTFTVSDECRNWANTSATVTVRDTVPPSVGVAATNKSVECDGAGNTQELQAWLDNHGGARASDTCSGTDVTWTHDHRPEFMCGSTTISSTVFSVTDACGNQRDLQPVSFAIVDTQPPRLGLAGANPQVAEAGFPWQG